MQRKSIFVSLQSFVVIPILATSFSIGPISFEKIPTVRVLVTEQNGTQISEQADNHQTELDEMAVKIDSYLANRNAPLAGHGKVLVAEAEKNGLPLTLLAAIAVQESGGCKYIIPGNNNCFGWGSGKIKFDSIDEAIAIIALNLGGNNPDTAHWYKKDQEVKEILEIYNPPHADPTYYKKILRIMSTIEQYPINVVGGKKEA